MIADCPATPVHAGPMPRSATLGALRWIQPTPAPRRFYGIVFASMPPSAAFALYTHGEAPDGSAMKILWIVRKGTVDRVLTIRGSEIGGTDTFLQHFTRAGGSNVPGANYPSIVELPHAGCWRLALSTGSAKATVVVAGVDP